MAATSSGSPSGSARRPSESRRWLKKRLPRRMLERLAPKKKKLLLSPGQALWDRARFFIRSWWVWAGFAVLFFLMDNHGGGIGCSIAAFFFYYASPRFHPAVYAIETPLRTDSREFRATIGGVTGSPLLAGNRVDIYNNGDEFYPAMLEAIESATQSITMEQYIFWASEVGMRFAEAFAERSASGVPVKILVDHVGSSNIGEAILKTLELGGCELAWFRPVRFYTLNRANYRDHRKSLIIDGRVAFTGGAGFADHWLGNARNKDEWREMQVRVEGFAALAQQSGFAQNWLATTGEMIIGDRYFPRAEEAGDVAVQTILSSPRLTAGAAGSMYLLALQCARQSIYIANPYFIPSTAVINILADLVRRGVEVKLMLSGPSSDTWWARQNSVRLYGKLFDAGVEIYEYEPTMLHQKTMVVDDHWATIGTTNFDNRSFALNEETNVCFHDPVAVGRMKEIFLEDLKCCRRIVREEWKRRGPYQISQEWCASLLEDQV